LYLPMCLPLLREGAYRAPSLPLAGPGILSHPCHRRPAIAIRPPGLRQAGRRQYSI